MAPTALVTSGEIASRHALQPHLQQLRYLGQIGFVRGLKECLAGIAAEDAVARPLSMALLDMVEALRLSEFLNKLNEVDLDEG